MNDAERYKELRDAVREYLSTDKPSRERMAANFNMAALVDRPVIIEVNAGVAQGQPVPKRTTILFEGPGPVEVGGGGLRVIS